MWAICKKDLKQYFVGAAGFLLIAGFFCISGIIFTTSNLLVLDSRFPHLVSGLTPLFMIIIPMITMRTFSDEKRSGTLQLLLTSPISVVSLVMGKFLATVAVLFLTTSSLILFYSTLSVFGKPILSESIIALLGFYLFGLYYLGLGVLISALVESSFVAAVGTFFLVFLNWILDGVYVLLPASPMWTLVVFIALAGLMIVLIHHSLGNVHLSVIVSVALVALLLLLFLLRPTWLEGLLPNALGLSLPSQRYVSFLMGIMRFSDVVYFLSSTSLFVFLTIRVIDRIRWS